MTTKPKDKTMETKYPIPPPHIHAVTIKAWADGAKVLEQGNDGKYYPVENPDFWKATGYRVDPACAYAKAKIAELGGDEMVEPYIYWLDGGDVEYKLVTNSTYHDWQPIGREDNPYGFFLNALSHKVFLRKKKRMIKQVLWIRAVHSSGINRKWVNENTTINCPDWHKVPSAIREVEASD